MKKRIKSLVAFALVLIVSLAAIPTVSGAEITTPETEIISPQYEIINMMSASLTDLENDTAEFAVNCNGPTSVIRVDIDVELQKRGFLGIYTKVDTASKTTTNKPYASFVGLFSIDSSETYRLKVTCTLYTASSSESETFYSRATD